MNDNSIVNTKLALAMYYKICIASYSVIILKQMTTAIATIKSKEN